MKVAKNHEEAFAELDAVAFDLLDPAERDAIMEHVRTCTACRAELNALRETASELAFVAPAAPEADIGMRGRVRERLIARAGGNTQPRMPALTPLVFPPPSQNPVRTGVPTWLAIAAGVLLVASLGVSAWMFNRRQPLIDALKSQVALTEITRRTADSLSQQLAARDSLIAGVAGRDVTVLTLTSQAAKDPYARMFWDRTRHTWTMIAHNMPELKSGRTYQLWLVTPKSRISAGTFVAKNGSAVVRATYDLTEPLNAIAVTDEPAPGVAQPTGNPIIVAAAPK
jgi:anti-sigma factor RsiW